MGVELNGPVAPASPPEGPERVAGDDDDRPAPVRRHLPDPGTALAWLGVGPAVVLVAWLLGAYPFAATGNARPFPTLLVALPMIVAAVYLLRRLPPIPETPLWVVPATAAVAVAFVGLSVSTDATHVILRRDAGVYAFVAHWIAEHGSITVPIPFEVIGGPDPSFTAASPGFYWMHSELTPQFMSGAGLSLAPGGWLAGWSGISAMPGVYGGLALLAVGGLAGRLFGPRWAPLAALALGLSQPIMLTARTTFSEPIAQLLLFGGLCLLVDAVSANAAGRTIGRQPDWPVRAAAVAGLAFGIGLLVRVDTLRDLVLLVPVVGWLAARRNRVWLPLALGAVVGACYGVADMLGPSQKYLADLHDLVPALIAAGVAAIVVSTAAVFIARVVWPRFGGRLPWDAATGWHRAGIAAAGLVGLVALYLVSRPLSGPLRDPDADYVSMLGGLQRDQGLALDPTRSYVEQSVRWVSWYVGWPAVILAAAAAVALAYLAVSRQRDRLLVGLAVPLGSALLVLWRPNITPDHPWADRRLVPTVLPMTILLAVAATAGGARLLRGRSVPVARGIVALGVVVLLVPTAWASLPMSGARTERGELAAAEAACAAFPAGSVALAVDARSRQEWMPAIRQICGVPTFAVPGRGGDDTATRAEVDTVVARIREHGGTPMLIAQSGTPLPDLTSRPQQQVVDLVSAEHQRLLTRRPERTYRLTVELWVAPAN